MGGFHMIGSGRDKVLPLHLLCSSPCGRWPGCMRLSCCPCACGHRLSSMPCDMAQATCCYVAPQIESEEDLRKAAAVVQELALDGLIITGGDDSNTNAAVLANFFLATGGG